MKKITIACMAAMSGVLFCGQVSAQPAQMPMASMSQDASKPMINAGSVTLANLMSAFTAETNAKAQYLAWAAKADEEGYKKVAQLFRAAAKSQEIHSGLHSEAIKALGGVPMAGQQMPVVKSTKENLQQALMNENEAAGKLYPGFLAQAKADNVKAAVIAFGSALEIYAGRKPIYEKALKNLDSWKKSKKGFLVCTVCGNLVESITFMKCPVCSAPVDKFVRVI